MRRMSCGAHDAAHVAVLVLDRDVEDTVHVGACTAISRGTMVCDQLSSVAQTMTFCGLPS
jgi:UDP-3-O-[3-hydroxymyristoyl] glucosamine N-acyltransferase